MKSIVITLLTAAALSFALTAYAEDFEGAGSAGPTRAAVTASSEMPRYAGRTCSGEEVAPTIQYFYFGFYDKAGNCGTMAYQANSRDEALDCAAKACPDCVISNITGNYLFGSAVQQYNTTNTYCPVK